MTALKSLTFTTLPQVTANPTLDRRTRIIARLEEQKLLLADPNYARTLRTTVTQDGVKNVVEKQARCDTKGPLAFFWSMACFVRWAHFNVRFTLMLSKKA